MIIVNPQSRDDLLSRLNTPTQSSLDQEDPRHVQLQGLDDVLNDQTDHGDTLHLLLLPGTQGQHEGVLRPPVEVPYLGELVETLAARGEDGASVGDRVQQRPVQLPDSI